MRAKLAGLIREYSAGKELAEKTGLDPALMERLKSLGYAGFSGGGDPTITNRDLPDPKDRIATYELISDAIADSQHGRYPESIEKLKAAIKTEPQSVSAHYLQGLNYYRSKMFPEAVDELQKTVQLSPDYSLAIFNLGMAQAHAGQIDPDQLRGCLQSRSGVHPEERVATGGQSVPAINRDQSGPCPQSSRVG